MCSVSYQPFLPRKKQGEEKKTRRERKNVRSVKKRSNGERMIVKEKKYVRKGRRKAT